MNTANPISNDAGSDPKSGTEAPADPMVNPLIEPAAEPAQPSQQTQPPHSPQTVAPATESQKLRPSTGPIIWGALVLAFCLYVAQRTLAPGTVDSVTWLIAGITGLGALLLAVGIIVLVRTGTNK